ncbi:MAG: hypothetical protein U0992_18360 [Planctomycetaceae bacterium]
MKDAAVTLNGRTGILSSHLPFGDRAVAGISAASAEAASASRK